MSHRDRLPTSRNTRTRVLLSALALATGSMTAQALTLGRFQTLSGIGEPLRAEIEITSMTEQEAQGLRTQIAGPRAFQLQGMEFNPALEGLNASIESRAGGRTVIVLQGRKPVQDNFIDLILETQWATGRLTRNYAVLLSTVADTSRPQQPRVQPSSAPTATDSPTPRVEYNAQNIPVYRFNNPDSAAPSKTLPPARTAASPGATDGLSVPAVQARQATASDSSITVEPGQTASGIVLAHMPASVTLDQMLIALLRENPQAFIQDNVNLVRAGARLRIPNADQARQTTAEQARELVLAQHREFAEYARRIAQTPLQLGKDQDRETSGKLVNKPAAASAPGKAQDTLTLSKATGADNREAALAAQAQAREASDQLDALQKNVAELSSLATAASEPASAPTGLAASLTDNRSVWLWGAALAALLGLVLWWRNRRQAAEPVFAPAYDDESEPHVQAEPLTSTAPIPPQMSSIDLDLPDRPAPSVFAGSPRATSEDDTEAAKLELASLLSAKGDTAIARSLIESVLASDSAHHKARAQKMLSQLL